MSYPQGPQYGGGYQQQQPGGYPQQGGYPPQQPGYPPPYPPKKNNNGLIIALAGVAAAAVIALVLVLVLSGKDDSGDSTAAGDKPIGAPDVTVPGPNKPPPGSGRSTSGGGSGGAGSPEALAEMAVDTIESHSTSAIDTWACSSTAASELKRELQRLPAGTKGEVLGVNETGSDAQARIKLTVGSQSQTITMEMRKSGSKWCVSGI